MEGRLWTEFTSFNKMGSVLSWTTKSLSNYKDAACHETLHLILLPSAVVRAEHIWTT